MQTIDATPTWSGIIQLMLDAYARTAIRQDRTTSFNKKHDEEISLRNLAGEFEKMAMAADKWNDHIKAEQKLADDFEQKRENWKKEIE